jgi:hypothetical protein
MTEQENLLMTTAKAASDGTKDPASPPERISGVARVQDAQAYHLASVAHDAAFEAERLCNDIYRAATGPYLRESTAETLADPAMIRKAEDAVICLATAQVYLTDLFYGSLPA